MTRDRVSVLLLNVGGVLMGIGALLDLSVSEPPALWEVFLGQSPSGLPAPVQQLVLSLLHALGSVLLAASLAVLRLAIDRGGELYLLSKGDGVLRAVVDAAALPLLRPRNAFTYAPFK